MCKQERMHVTEALSARECCHQSMRLLTEIYYLPVKPVFVLQLNRDLHKKYCWVEPC